MKVMKVLRKLRNNVGDLLYVAGALVVSSGVGMYSVPAGVITLGVSLIAVGVIVELASEPRGSEGKGN